MFRAFTHAALAAPLLAALALAADAPARDDIDPAKLAARVDAYCKPLVEAGHLSGTLLVARGDRVLLERSFGDANRELGIPNTPETRQCIASISKPITVMLAAMLINEGKLGLQDTLERWIPGFPNGRRTTIEHLLHHRAGIPHRVTTDRDETEPMTPAQLAGLAMKAVPLGEPGVASVYSSAGYTVLTRVLELASGRTYAELVRERIAKPAGLTHTGHANSLELLPPRAASYVPSLDGVQDAPLKDLSFLAGAGSLYSTPRDLHQLIRAVVAGRFPAEARASVMYRARIAWNGSTNGFRAWADYDTASQVAAIFAGNLHTGAPDLLRQAVAEIVAGRDPGVARLPAHEPFAIEPARLRGFEGVYTMENGTRLEVRARGAGLEANDWPMLPTADSTFFCPRDYGVVRMVAGPGGKPSGMAWTVAGQPFTIPRTADLEPPTGH